MKYAKKYMIYMYVITTKYGHGGFLVYTISVNVLNTIILWKTYPYIAYS